MSDDVSTIVTNLVTAIDTERTDVICSVLSELKKYTHDPDILPKVLNGLHTEYGTLLHYATKQGKADKVRALLAGGADPGIQNKEGLLPLDLATEHIRTVYNEELLKATAQSNLGRVCQLLAAGVSIKLTDSPEMLNTPLHWAVCHGNRDMVQCLCARGADLNVYNTRGLTPLHEAVKRGDAGIVEELLNYGADIDLQVSTGESVGQTALDLAEGHESLLQVLRAPRHLLESVSKITHDFDSKANLVRFDSLTSTDSVLVNGVNGENGFNSPRLEAPPYRDTKVRFETSSPVPTITDEKLLLLWPAVQSIKQGSGNPFVISNVLPIFVTPTHHGASASDVAFLWNLRRHIFEELDLELSLYLLSPLSLFESPHIICLVNKHLVAHRGSYKITVTSKQLKIISGDNESLNNAISTVLQLLSLYKSDDIISIPTLQIEDWPDLPHRGVLMDVSQGRIPVIGCLEEHLDTLSLLKINRVYLYTRFHSNLPPQWQCPYSRSEILHMSEFCHKRHIQLLPVVEVGPKVQFEDLPKLYSVLQDFLACFGTAEFVSAGPRLSSFILDQTEDNLGVGDVMRYLPMASHQMLQLCGYPLHDLNTSLLQQLPPGIIFKEYAVKNRADTLKLRFHEVLLVKYATACDKPLTYLHLISLTSPCFSSLYPPQADHDYKKFCTVLVDLGINYFACPGTAAWNSLAGCPEAAVSNIMSAATNTEGALGMVICDWTGKGHLNHQPFSWPGILTAAGLAWNKNTPKDILESSLPTLLDQYVYRDQGGALGKIVMDLGQAEMYAVRRARNQGNDDLTDLPEEQGSILYRFLIHPDAVPLEFLSTDALQHVTKHIRKCQAALSDVNSQCLYGDAIKAEIQLTIELMLLACKIGKALVLSGRKPEKQAGIGVVNFGISNLTVTTRTDLANRLLELIKQFKDVWALRSNPTVGLSDSLQRFRSLFKVLLPEPSHSELVNFELEH